jgi:wyosine [tRNA(Phe)-imidazoG37] synthetase (radical SAM superfamily)
MSLEQRNPYADHSGGGRRSGGLIYPVISRRSGGLSLGINLFPDGKRCSFDCPYCEVFTPAWNGRADSFDARRLEDELAAFAEVEGPLRFPSEPLRDISFSGDGEPTLSPHLGEALAIASAARRRHPFFASADLVLITNSTGFLDPTISALLRRFVSEERLSVWAKLDAGTEAWYRRMNRSSLPFDTLVAGLASFAQSSPVSIQTMVLRLEGELPPEPEILAYADLVSRLRGSGAKIGEIQLYTQARPSPEGITAPLTDAELLGVAALLRSHLIPGLPLRAFGSGGELPPG